MVFDLFLGKIGKLKKDVREKEKSLFDKYFNIMNMVSVGIFCFDVDSLKNPKIRKLKRSMLNDGLRVLDDIDNLNNGAYNGK